MTGLLLRAQFRYSFLSAAHTGQRLAFLHSPSTVCMSQFLDPEVAQVQLTTNHNLVNGCTGSLAPSSDHVASLRGRRLLLVVCEAKAVVLDLLTRRCVRHMRGVGSERVWWSWWKASALFVSCLSLSFSAVYRVKEVPKANLEGKSPTCISLLFLGGQVGPSGSVEFMPCSLSHSNLFSSFGLLRDATDPACGCSCRRSPELQGLQSCAGLPLRSGAPMAS